MGVSDYCLTPAYAGLQLAHLVLWAGGRWSARQAGASNGLVRMAGMAVGATALAFVISNGAFFWLGGRVAEPGMAQFAQTFVDYAPGFLASTLLYLGLAALAHAFIANLGRGRGAHIGGVR
jgi:hypothetical protein